MTAPWPGGRAESHDVIVPVVVTVNADGTVASVEIEATVSKELDEAGTEQAITDGWNSITEQVGKDKQLAAYVASLGIKK